MQNKLFLAFLPLLALAVPAAILSSADWSALSKAPEDPAAALAAISATATANPPGPAPSPAAEGTASASGAGPSRPAARAAESGMTQDLAEVLRFDVTPGWIMSRWTWVTAGLSHLELQGYRVPLVTGTAEDDLAGPLTYYFNPKQQVQRIAFQGTTGDPGKLIRLLAARFRFGRGLTNDPGIFRYEVAEPRGPAKSYLEVRLAKPNDPPRRFAVNLVIERPQGT